MDGSGEAKVRPRPNFIYEEAFSRNLGWLTDWEQQALRFKRVAVAGMGGVGGVHLLTLARFGIGAFHIADLDRFELPNFNRQIGATMASLGQAKVDVLAAMARDINPELAIETFAEGVNEANLDSFLENIDLFIDGLDFFVLDIRRRVFARCRELGIPAITAAPLGMGSAYLVFHPQGMSFEDYFQFGAQPEARQYVRFLLGLAPKGLHFGYLADARRVDLAGHRGPSTVAAVQLCAGAAAAEAVKLLVGRGPVRAAPHFHQYDAYRGRWIGGYLRSGNKNILQRLKLALATRAFATMSQQSALAPEIPPLSDLERIVDAARWTPSADNAQPWQIDIAGPDRLVVTITSPTRDDVFRYRDGEPTMLAVGMLLESIRIAASSLGRSVQWSYRADENSEQHIEISLPRTEGTKPDPLLASLFLRSVDRRLYPRGRLNVAQKEDLARSLGGVLDIAWHETAAARWRFARLGALATRLRLRRADAIETWRRTIDWQNSYSATHIPALTLGLGKLARNVAQWALKDARRLHRVCTFPGTALLATSRADYLPSFCSAALFTLALPTQRPDDAAARATMLLEAGSAIQRFWLTATRLGLALQPRLAPLIVGADATRRGTSVQNSPARTLDEELNKITGGKSDALVFLGRIGLKSTQLEKARSLRRAWNQLGRAPMGS